MIEMRGLPEYFRLDKQNRKDFFQHLTHDLKVKN